MRTLDNCWLFRGGAYTDLTTNAPTGLAQTIQAGDKLYFGQRDWLAGLLFFVNAPASVMTYTIEVYDGEAWERLLPEKSYENLRSGFVWDTAWQFQSDGALFWGRIPYHLAQEKASSTFPEAHAPPSTDTRYWFRITFTAVSSLILSRVHPLLYNTYASVKDVGNFLSLPNYFTDTSSPSADVVRQSIRDQEDWLDNYCRRSWRTRYKVGETHGFNPYGIRPKNQPPMEVTRVALWNGSALDVMTSGRGDQYFLDREVGMVYFTLPSFRLRYYSFLLSRYLRQPGSLIIDYLYGDDFETSKNAADVQFIIQRLVGADLVRNNDETGMFSSGLEVLSKSEKVAEWQKTAEDRADNLRWPVMSGLGAATF